MNEEGDQKSENKMRYMMSQVMAATYPGWKTVFKDTRSISEGKSRKEHDYPFYGLVLIKSEFIGCVWVITCGNSLLSTLRHSNKGGSARFSNT